MEILSRSQDQIESTKTLSILDKQRVHLFRSEVLRWYDREGRDLPWRHTRDPYCILVSEIMLHQTQVNRVLSKYREWISVYPTFEALAIAPLKEIQEMWRPLGYNYRPKRLHHIARKVVKEYGGKLPNTLKKLEEFNGVGRYTAGAILSFAFHKDAPIVDTNVRRVIKRVFGIRGNLFRTPIKNRIWYLAKVMIPPGKGYIFNQALIDFGALVCTACKPVCFSCFMKELCLWRIQNAFNK
jgi:A/G-specific adenine glycosylase